MSFILLYNQMNCLSMKNLLTILPQFGYILQIYNVVYDS